MATRSSLTLFTSIVSVTVANTVTETSLITAGIGSTVLPADFFKIGKSLRIRMMGFHSATGNPNITIKIKLNSIVVLTTGAVVCGNGTDDLVFLDALITCRAVGDLATGKIMSQGYYRELCGGPNNFQLINNSFQFNDTTIQQTLDITVEWGTADPGNTITATNIILESL